MSIEGSGAICGGPGTLVAMDWWGIACIVVAGVAVVAYGYFDDKRKSFPPDFERDPNARYVFRV